MPDFVQSVDGKLNERAFEAIVRGTEFEDSRPVIAKLSAIKIPKGHLIPGKVYTKADVRNNPALRDFGVIATRYVSTAFMTVVANAMRGVAADVTRLQNYKYHQWGSSATAENKTQTGCLSPETPAGDSGLVAGTQAGSGVTYVTVGTITADGSTNSPITEHCVHPTSTEGTYGLDRSSGFSIAVSEGDSIQFTYTLTLASDMP